MTKQSIWSNDSQFRTGQTVRVGDNIKAVVEEIIFARAMLTPMYAVEWWQDGQLVSRRMHEDDLHLWEGRP